MSAVCKTSLADIALKLCNSNKIEFVTQKNKRLWFLNLASAQPFDKLRLIAAQGKNALR
jgi:hypothetical protein